MSAMCVYIESEISTRTIVIVNFTFANHNKTLTMLMLCSKYNYVMAGHGFMKRGLPHVQFYVLERLTFI